MQRSKKFVFVEPGGNFGDQLILKGAYKLADRAGLSYSKVTFNDFMNAAYPAEAIIYIHGGGGLNDFWSGKPVRALRKSVSTHQGQVILGPQTCQTDDSFLDHFITEVFAQARAKDIILFCREAVSYQHLKRKVGDLATVILDHDTALNLEPDDLKINVKKHSNILYCLRSDKEMDSSQEYNVFSNWIDPVLCSRTFAEWLDLHAGAKRIVTNRLHSAILASIFGIPVTLLPNNYHKNYAVWEFSLRRRGVHWSNRVDAPVFGGRLNRIKILRKFRHSKFCQRIIQRIFI